MKIEPTKPTSKLSQSSLNPYSNGMKIELYDEGAHYVYENSLNPYSNGMKIEHF